MDTPEVYIPIDRRIALAQGRSLPERTHGAALFADISGFTPLTEMLARELGPKRGAEELTGYLNRVYDALITELHRCGGVVIGFSGDAISCWFDGDPGLRAISTALAMQAAMARFSNLQVYGGGTVSLAMKAAVAAGPARRFVVGDPNYTLVDVMAGATLERLAMTEHQAGKGEVVLDGDTALALAGQVEIAEWRLDEHTWQRAAVVSGLNVPVQDQPWDFTDLEMLAEAQARPWLLPAVYQRLASGGGEFLAELRPAAALFLRFSGIDYEGDEQAPAKLDVFIRRVENILSRYDGSLIQLTIGDKGSYLYAAFGAPIAHEDDVDRAALAALDLQALPALLEFLEPLQIGITYGRMRVGAYGGVQRRTYGVLGDAVNLAARLMQAARPGQILASTEARSRSGDDFQWEALPAMRVKGKSEPVALHALGRARRRRSGPAYSTLYPRPPIGREEILTRLRAGLDDLENGRGGIVRLAGEAGMGKSYLAAHISREAQERGFLVELGTCQGVTQSTPYLPWRQIFQNLLALEEGGETELSARLSSFVSETNPDWALRLPLLGDLLDLPIPDNPATASMDSDLRQKSLFSLLVEMMQYWARKSPLVLIIENAHWMDENSLALTKTLARQVAGAAPVMLLLVHRPDLLGNERLLPELSDLPHSLALPLEAMPAEEAASLIERQLGAPPSRLLIEIVMITARGNPFFVVELVEAMKAEGQLEKLEEGSWGISTAMLEVLQRGNHLLQVEGQWQLKPQVDFSTVSLGMPDSIHKLILSRLDRLPEDHALTLKVSSVVGNIIDLVLVAYVHPDEKDLVEIETEAERMQAEEVIREDDRERHLYSFSHHSLQEVAYETLLYTQRQQLHQALAQVLAHEAPEAIAQIAHHAYLGQDWLLALEYNLAAGERAKELHANQQSIDFFQKALHAAGELGGVDTAGDRKQIHLALGELLVSTGQHSAAEEHLGQALALAIGDGDREAEARGCRWHARMHELRGEFALALTWIEKGFSALDGEVSAEEAELSLIAGLINVRQGNFEAAWGLCERSLAVSQTLGDRAIEARTANLMGIVELRGGGKTAIERFDQSLALYKQLGNVYGQATSHNLIANGFFAISQLSNADYHYRQALDLFTQIGNVYNQVLVNNNLGGIALKQGRLEEALGYYQRATRLLEQTGGSLWVFGAVYLNIGHTQVRRGELDEALAQLQAAEAYFERSKVRDQLPELYGLFAEALFLQGDPGRAKAYGARSLELARELQMPREEGHNLRILGEIARAEGRYEAAGGYFTISHDILDGAGDEYESAKVHLSSARLYLEQGQPEEALAALAECEPVFARLEAQLDLREVKAIRQQLTALAGTGQR
jgi:class 3 adenylate cyclase/tetratricopeptide (TPR) repeat protein